MRWPILMTCKVLVAAIALSMPARAVSAPAAVGAADETQSASCARLASLRFDAPVGAAVSVRSAAQVGESGDLPAYCRVVASIAPRNTVEIRLPVSGWGGRVLMAGCGGLCGAIQMERTDDALARGYAVAHTDMGHAETDVAFADDPRALEDFAHRSTHVATRLLKAVARAYYGRPHAHAYFRGCSTC